MQFTKTDVSAKYEIVGEHNPRISIGNYEGPLADAPLKVVEGMIQRKSQLVKAKSTATLEKSGNKQ